MFYRDRLTKKLCTIVRELGWLVDGVGVALVRFKDGSTRCAKFTDLVEVSQ